MESSVFNIVNSLQQFHADLSDYYFAQKANTYDRRVQNLLDYLGKSERYLEGYIDRHRLDLPNEILKSIVKIPTKNKDYSVLSFYDERPPEKLDEYVKTMSFAYRKDSLLINFCKLITENAGNRILEQTFNNFCRVSRKERKNLYSYNNMLAY